MATIRFSNGVTVNFNGNPTQADIEEVARGFQTQEPQQEQANPYNAIFRATGQEGGIQSGLKAIGNLPTSAYTLGKNIVGAVTSPIQTAKGVGNLIADAGAVVTNKLTDLTGGGPKRDQATARALGSAYFGEDGRYGSFANTQKTVIEDPFGVGSDILAVLQGGAGLTGKTAQLNNVLSKTARVATAPVRIPAQAAARATGSAARFSASQATGLTPETIGTIVDNPKGFSAAQASGATRVDLADDVFSAIKKAGDELSDLGTGYDAVRKSGQIVSLADDWLTKSLDDFGLKVKYDNAPAIVNGVPDLNVAPKATIVADRTSKTRNVTDINKIQSFVDNWGSSKTFTAEEYLNMRSDLAELAKYDMAGTTVARDFGTRVREGVLNSDKVRKQISGLKDLDAKYSEDVKFFKKMEKEFLNPDGKLKDGAASKVVNAVNASNPERLARLERLYPGFTKQAKVIKAVEDVENAMGLKVGSYTRAGVAVAGVATGNLPLILGAILSTPEIIVPLLKGLGYTNKTIGPILAAIRDFASDINNFRVPGAIEEYMKKNYKDGVPVGMSIKKSVTPESVAKKIDSEDFNRLIDVIEDPALAKANPDTMRMLDNMGLGRATDEELVKFAKEVTDEAQLMKDKITPKPTTLLEEAKKYKSAEEFWKADHELPLESLDLGGLKYEDWLKEPGGGLPSLTPDKPIVVIMRDGKNLIADGVHRYFEHLKRGDKTIKVTYSKSQLTDIWKKANETKPTLLEEAKKYKSAEEFAESQGVLVHHGSSKKFESVDDIDFKENAFYTLKKTDDVLKEIKSSKGYFTPDELRRMPAEAFGKNVNDFVVDFKKPLVVDAKGKSWMDTDGEWSDWTTKQVNKAKKNGNDGVIIKNIREGFSSSGTLGEEAGLVDDYIVFDKNTIKTRRELEEIWKQANK